MLLARNSHDVVLWSRTGEEAARLQAAREHRERLPGIAFPSSLSVTADARELAVAELLVLAVPSQTVRENLRRTAAYLPADAPLVSAVKGLERDTAKRVSEMAAEELPGRSPGRFCALSGPNLSREIARGLPSASVVASVDPAVAARVRDTFMSPAFRVYTSEDVIGVELGGALKNLIAICAGMGDGFAYGDNGKAAFITRGLSEITRLGVAAGANPLTFAGLAGMGDLVATCYSPLSRNRRVGEELAQGKSLAEALSGLGDQVAEGVETTRPALLLAHRLGVEMPITEALSRFLFEALDPRRALLELLVRAPRAETAGLSQQPSG